MNTAPPSAELIDDRVEFALATLRRRTFRRRIAFRAGITTAAVALLALGGTGVAAAVLTPQYFDLRGVVKAPYAERFAQCVREAGWDARVVDDASAHRTLEDRRLDPSAYRVVASHLLQSTEDKPAERSRRVSTASVLRSGSRSFRHREIGTRSFSARRPRRGRIGSWPTS